MKHLKLHDEDHLTVKVEAAKAGIQMQEMAHQIIKKSFPDSTRKPSKKASQ